MSNDEPLPVEFTMFFSLQAFFTIGVLHWILSIMTGGLTMYLRLGIYMRILE
jgi:hypothetical protein